MDQLQCLFAEGPPAFYDQISAQQGLRLNMDRLFDIVAAIPKVMEVME
jgi:hypothetical protein